MTEKKITCNKCTHFYVTWDKQYPRGCRAMNFKSKDLPSTVVYESSGLECQKFKAKKK
ncbi:MAG: hypothetical protein JSU99_02875 [Nitrospiraceae bacterium]|nr:MAG: hypothetical protein JSU99_02875 [Nitrospiraceae bacterium]